MKIGGIRKLLLSLEGAVYFNLRNHAFLRIYSRSLYKLPEHSHVCGSSVYTANRYVDWLMKAGNLASAFSVFDEIPERDVITWNIMISGLCRYGCKSEAWSLYSRMIYEGFVENPSTFSVVLSISSSERLFREGIVLHCRSIILGFNRNAYICSALVDLYFQMGLDDVGFRLFRMLENRNLATWNIVLRYFSEFGRSHELLRLYSDMRLDELEPNGLSFCYIIRGCGCENLIDEGTQLHCCVIKKGHIDSNLFVANALVDFYSACGNLTEALKSFKDIPPMDVISWNSMVSVFAANGFAVDALECYRGMHLWGKKPSICSFVSLLKLSGATMDLQLGMQIHCCIMKLGFDNPVVESSLIDMYGKCGDIGTSFSIFTVMNHRTIICCNALMASLLRTELSKDVIELFGLMVDENIGYDEVSLSLALKALSVTASSSCTVLHCCAIKTGFDSNTTVASSLIDAYSKIGEIDHSSQIFNEHPSPNVICSTSIISAYARNGQGIKCLEVLNTMTQNGLKPDEVTYLNVLSGCNHCGMVEDGRSVFQQMQMQPGLKPDRRHYSCMIDLLGRASLVNEALDLLKECTFGNDAMILSSVLRSCKVHKMEEIGRGIAQRLVDSDSQSSYVWLQASGFYSAIGDTDMAAHCREIALAREITRNIGHSLVHV